MLLEAGADPNIQCVDGTTVLHEASRKGLTKFVKLLLKYDADPCIRDVGKRSCFESAKNFPEILELFEPYKHKLQPVIEIQDSPERLMKDCSILALSIALSLNPVPKQRLQI